MASPPPAGPQFSLSTPVGLPLEVIENIVVDHTPLEHIIPWRAVAKCFQIRVDKRLKSYYVELVRDPYHCTCNFICHVMPCTRDGHTDRSVLCAEDLLKEGALVKVLLCEDFSHTLVLSNVLKRLGTVHTLQRTGYMPLDTRRFRQLPGITTVVDSVDLTTLYAPFIPRKGPEFVPPVGRPRRSRGEAKSRLRLRIMLDKATGKKHHIEYYHLVEVPPTVRRHIVHISLCQELRANDRHWMMHDLRFQHPPGLGEFLLVLWPHFWPLYWCDPPPTYRPFASIPQTFTSLLAAVATSALDGRPTTVVSADRLSPLLFNENAARAADPTDMVNKVKDIVRQRMRHALEKENNDSKETMEERLERAFDRIRFISLEAWWAELGEPRRRYEGFALGGAGIDKHESYSLELVAQYVAAHPGV
ncbi:uncharacterized protein LOC62_04G005247 [Vanrija pseudolonga]|uniref:Uncharacterized protein n=1 Tax=Vanrija pseudolonga TaxID=143232 RepID=A0AAF0YBL5_9TREE|nr:hypothetical protein LOC62_04G005247 [Vanrija pseudolonga]